eukprot:CAMPEP_0206214272 /NCGR_PEP_ID=MMETSP0047_2-20121206/1577_1 /ASSEMBLY_ACC=CAM_ASM_000192 /TAXON_ID=195065 /ORGANISM="Chroomonas mesostigmatica_cf, Strain CCMP1168" /LENGTH=251 /DNA_ID=CAMNT_0053636497 /DNA_START=138 /DNA_END=890 /DNA_ORIENTATION=-
MAKAACGLPISSFTPLSIALIANAFAKARQDELPGNAPLFQHLGQAILSIPPPRFDQQNIANVVNAFPRQPKMRDAVMTHMASAIVAQRREALGPQAIANILNGFATGSRGDEGVLDHLKLATLKQRQTAWTSQEIATSLHALASLNIGDAEWGGYLCEAALTLTPQSFQPEEIAMLGWSAAVLRWDDSRLLRLIVSGMDTHIASMDRRSLRQVHQFLLTCRLDPEVASRAPPSSGMLEGLEGAKCRAAFE